LINVSFEEEMIKKAVIMAGGFGTRLRPLTMEIPKPMVPIINTPMMEHIVNLLKKNNITDILSVLYFQPHKISGYFNDGSNYGITMNYVQAVADYGTAGSVRNACDGVSEPIIIISGDVLTDFDLSKAIEFHKSKGAKATIMLTRVPSPTEYGIVMTDKEGLITRFLEKPSWGQVFSDTINTGIYILEADVVDMIPFRSEYDFSKDLFPKMLELGMPLYGYIAEGYWKDVGNLNEYQAGQTDALFGNVKVEFKGNKINNAFVGQNVKIDESVDFKGLVAVGNDVVIGADCQIENSVIGNNCTIGKGVKLSGVTLWENVFIDDEAQLTDDVICSNVKIGKQVNIANNVFVAENCNVGDEATLNANIKLWPNINIDKGATLSRTLVQESKWARELFTDARISGISNIEMNPEFGAKLGSALGMTFGKNNVVLGSRDADNVSRLLKRSITAGMLSVGVEVNDLQTTSIPQTRQELRTGKYTGGFHVRRSPRNPNNLDIIIFNHDGRDISINTSKKIERYFFGEDIKRVTPEEVGLISYPERTNEIYVKRFLDALNIELIKERRFKLFIDYSYGLAASVFPYILGKLNVEALSQHDYIDSSRFHPDPFSADMTKDNTGKIMRSLGYELGFRMEAGAEKIALIDERGEWYPTLRMLTIITKLFLETNKQSEPYKIAVSICATSDIEEIAKDYNVEVNRIPNSHSAMMEATLEDNIKFVGGVYGGYIFTDFLCASDGMFTIGRLLEMLAETKTTFAELDSNLPNRVQVIEHADCSWEHKGLVMRKAMEHSENMKRELVEGVKIFIENQSVLLVPAKEKAAFIVYAESNDANSANELAQKYKMMIGDWITQS